MNEVIKQMQKRIVEGIKLSDKKQQNQLRKDVEQTLQESIKDLAENGGGLKAEERFWKRLEHIADKEPKNRIIYQNYQDLSYFWQYTENWYSCYPPNLSEEEREKALAKVLPYQQGDFEGLFEALEGNPVTIRFLDPPLHEFVPTEEADIKKLADAQGKTVDQIKTIIASLHEFNPMMGHRGCRLAVTYPEIAKMQTTAVIRAAIEVKKAHPDWTIKPEIMIPLVGDVKELKYVKKFVVETADAEIKAAGSDLQYEVGTMIEIPRAALTADEIAKEADFFCFGTNDLTQMTYGFSRDDAGKFLNAYYDAKIFENDPFAKLDQVGVGKLMKMAIELGKPVNPNLHVGICGEHGGDPSSVEFCHKIGLNYVSCSPFRVPIARLAAAQAAIAEKNA